MILYDDLKNTTKPSLASNPKIGSAQQPTLTIHKHLSKKTKRMNTAMDTVDLNCSDPLLSSSHLALLCANLPMAQSSITTTTSLVNSTTTNSEILAHEDLHFSMNGVDHGLAPPSPPWDEDEDVTMMMSSQGFKSFCSSSEMSEGLQSDDSSKVSSMVDEFLSYSPDSLRLDSDTDEAINSFLLEAAAAVAHPSSPLSGSEMSSIKIDDIPEVEDDGSNLSRMSLPEEQNPTQLSKDQNETSTNMRRHCDDKICSIKTQKNKADQLPRYKNQGQNEVPWNKVVLTIDDDNNIIEDIDENEETQGICCTRNLASNDSRIKCKSSKKSGKDKNQILEHKVDGGCITQGLFNRKQPSHEVYSHCSVCKLVFTSETQLAEHRLAYADRIACCHCCKTFATMSKLRVHHRKHSKEKPFQCLSCGKYYTHRQSLLRHQLLYCPPLRAKCNSGGSSTSIIESPNEEDNKGPLPSYLDTVLIKIEDVSEQEQREFRVSNSTQESEENINLSPTNSITSENALQNIEEVSVKSNYKATKNFTQNNVDHVTRSRSTRTETTSSLRGAKRKRATEIDNVDNEEETGCRVCDKEFYDVDSLVNHREYHLTHRTCCLCQKVMGNKSKLLTHHRSHTKELPYACHVCEKRFAENSTLRKHEATHGERNFRCDVCSKAFVRKDYLAKHMLTHQQTYKCSQCDFVCHNRSDIEGHISKMHRS